MGIKHTRVGLEVQLNHPTKRKDGENNEALELRVDNLTTKVDEQQNNIDFNN